MREQGKIFWETKVCYDSGPHLFGTRDWFPGRQFFHRPRGEWFGYDSHKELETEIFRICGSQYSLCFYENLMLLFI